MLIFIPENITVTETNRVPALAELNVQEGGHIMSRSSPKMQGTEGDIQGAVRAKRNATGMGLISVRATLELSPQGL